jgi:uncharacterized membrane protein YkvA (DUF1232 family)
MHSVAELREFQLAAVERIVSRLTDRNGSRRFLLADEVGLGKTLVAKGVIDQLRDKKKGKGFTVVYICSNSEIADQNRGKLCDDKDSTAPGRLSLLSIQSQDILKRRENGQLQVFAFTPGTSLQVERGTGVAGERRLLLWLLYRVWGKRINLMKWRRFFRCSSGEEWWTITTRPGRLRDEFNRKIATDLQIKLKEQWDSQKLNLVNAITCQVEPKQSYLADRIDACVDDFEKDETSYAVKKNRNLIIGELRKGLSRLSLEFLDPQLILLDEFQRFSDILTESNDEKTIVGKLFTKGSGAILILSATPYKMYTLEHESEDHHEDFLKTVSFLKKESVGGPILTKIDSNLKEFRRHLDYGEWATADDHGLYELRECIERQLKEVMCRTERNWYLEDAAKGVEEITATGALPQKNELIEYIHLRQFLLGRKIGDWNITDFWKSSPSVISFMDGQYGLINRIRHEHIELPPTVLKPSIDLSASAPSSAKFQQFFDKIFDPASSQEIKKSWKYLWMRPTYTYYKDEFYNDFEPIKFLVFSHWRFVPKAVAVLTSQEAIKRVGVTRRKLQSSPLQFREKLAFSSFDICYPSPVLADCINQLKLRSGMQGVVMPKQLFDAARNEIKSLLLEYNVEIGKTRTMSLWKIMAYIEARSKYASEIKEGLESARRSKIGEMAEYLPHHVKKMIQWMDDNTQLSISPAELNRLTSIALYSPGVSFLRSFRSVFPQAPSEAWAEILNFCLGPLRHFFNKRISQTIIRQHGKGRFYTEKILSYSQKAHLQAVFDEYTYLVKNVLQEHKTNKFLEHIGRAMGMWSGSLGVNKRTRLGHISRRPQARPTHFALAFGDDISNESTEATGKARKSAVREAFNSPFWPFVLATTSVGQEGLDFHLYCQDIVHWNLPSNPVDLEQREGRINRYDGLSIRRNIAQDYQLDTICLQPGENIWNAVFRFLTEKSHENSIFKNGLSPHWLYQNKIGYEKEGRPGQTVLRRHLLFYKGSKDIKQYEELKKSLALYRLVLGQPRQQDILEKVLSQCKDKDSQQLNKLLEKYMINLSPLEPRHARQRANKEARRILSDPESLHSFLESVPRFMTLIPEQVQKDIQEKVMELVTMASGQDVSIDKKQQLYALEAIFYLLDPYDAVHDRYGVLGYSDDKKIIQDAYAKIC